MEKPKNRIDSVLNKLNFDAIARFVVDVARSSFISKNSAKTSRQKKCDTKQMRAPQTTKERIVSIESHKVSLAHNIGVYFTFCFSSFSSVCFLSFFVRLFVASVAHVSCACVLVARTLSARFVA